MAGQSGTAPGILTVNGSAGPNVVLGAADVGALALAGGTMAGAIDMGANTLSNAALVTSDEFVNGAIGYNYDVRVTPLVTSSPTPVSYLLHTTPSLTGGTYEIRIGVGIQTSNSGTQLESDLRIDGVSRGGPFLQTAVAGGRFTFAGAPIIEVAFAPGIHTVEIFAWKPGGPGDITVFFGAIAVERVQ